MRDYPRLTAINSTFIFKAINLSAYTNKNFINNFLTKTSFFFYVTHLANKE